MTISPSMVIVTFWLLFFAFVSSVQAEGRGIFYRVHSIRSQDATAYLMGSIHIGRDDFYPLPQHVEKSFKEAGQLVLEVDPAKLTTPAAQQDMLRAALLPTGDELCNHVAASTCQLAVQEGSRIGLPQPALKMFRPWMLAVTMQLLYLQKEGFSAENGVEQYFIRMGEGKRIEELESADFQIRLLNGFTDREQELFLLDTLRNLSDTSMLDAMMRAWRTGDAQALETVVMKPLREHPENAPVYEKLLFARNRAMATNIEQSMKEKKRPFVVIGAGHLLGPQGVVELLRKKGYAVEQQ